MKIYKSFREQYKECRKNGNLVETEKCYRCGQFLLICKKYGKLCSSNLCLKERSGK